MLPNGIAFDRWKTMCGKNALTGRHWLLAYEAPLHDWLPPSTFDNDNGGEKAEAYDFLRENDASFYVPLEDQEADEDDEDGDDVDDGFY